MALQKAYQSGYGMEFPKAYHRILSVIINRGIHGDTNMVTRVETWITAEARENLVSPVIIRDFILPIVEDIILETSVIGEVYNRLKELEDFAESEDV